MSTGYIRVMHDNNNQLRFLAVGVKNKVEVDITSGITYVRPEMVDDHLAFDVRLTGARLSPDIKQSAKEYAAATSSYHPHHKLASELGEARRAFEAQMEDSQKKLGEAQQQLEAYADLEKKLGDAQAELEAARTLLAMHEQAARLPAGGDDVMIVLPPETVEAPPRPPGRRRG